MREQQLQMLMLMRFRLYLVILAGSTDVLLLF
jgi:hypothetical protein